MIDEAIKIMNEAFRNKVDKAGQPYTAHCQRVFKGIPNGKDEDVKCIALLHDLLEDCPEWDEERLGRLFNERVVRGVVALTHKAGQPYSKYIDQVLQNTDATIVKLHDLKDNMDITRLDVLFDSDLKRLIKYHSAYQKLKLAIKPA